MLLTDMLALMRIYVLVMKGKRCKILEEFISYSEKFKLYNHVHTCQASIHIF